MLLTKGAHNTPCLQLETWTSPKWLKTLQMGDPLATPDIPTRRITHKRPKRPKRDCRLSKNAPNLRRDQLAPIRHTLLNRMTNFLLSLSKRKRRVLKRRNRKNMQTLHKKLNKSPPLPKMTIFPLLHYHPHKINSRNSWKRQSWRTLASHWTLSSPSPPTTRSTASPLRLTQPPSTNQTSRPITTNSISFNSCSMKQSPLSSSSSHGGEGSACRDRPARPISRIKT